MELSKMRNCKRPFFFYLYQNYCILNKEVRLNSLIHDSKFLKEKILKTAEMMMSFSLRIFPFT